jgi:hypothetical protein
VLLSNRKKLQHLFVISRSNAIFEVAMLVYVLVTGRVHNVRSLDGHRIHDIHTKFYDDRFTNSSTVKVNISTI